MVIDSKAAEAIKMQEKIQVKADLEGEGLNRLTCASGTSWPFCLSLRAFQDARLNLVAPFAMLCSEALIPCFLHTAAHGFRCLRA